MIYLVQKIRRQTSPLTPLCPEPQTHSVWYLTCEKVKHPLGNCSSKWKTFCSGWKVPWVAHTLCNTFSRFSMWRGCGYKEGAHHCRVLNKLLTPTTPRMFTWHLLLALLAPRMDSPPAFSRAFSPAAAACWQGCVRLIPLRREPPHSPRLVPRTASTT